MKKILLVILVALVLGAVAAVSAGLYLGSAADAIMDATWDDIAGRDLPVPWPLSEAEQEALRAELAATWPEDDPNDPLESVDLDAIALERALKRGQHIVEARLGCTDCHGEDYGGRTYAEAMPVFTLRAPNITSGAGGLPDAFTVADWDRLIRHGIRSNGKTAMMPAVDYQALSDQELSDVIAWVRSRPPVDRTIEESQRGPVGTVLIARGMIVPAVFAIDHDQPHRATPPAAEVNLEFGAHLARVCVGCHRADWRGGPIIGGDPSWPPASNLTPHAEGSEGWTAEQFIAAMRDGVRPDGSAIDPVMPFAMLGKMTDTELRAMHAWFQSLEPLATGE